MTLQEYFLESEKRRPEKAVKTYPKVPAQSAEWHKSRNGALSPNDVTPGSHRKVWWQCDKGHSWEAPVYYVAISGSGCPYCRGLRAIPGETDLASQFPEVAKLWDAERNAPLTPQDVTPGSKAKVWWQCQNAHRWQAAIFSITMNRSSCPYCSGLKAVSGETDLATLYPEVAAQWDFEKNPALDVRSISPFSHEKVWWQCDKGHSWQAAPYSRTKKKGSGCPYCTGKKVLAGYNDLATLWPELAKEWDPLLNGDLTPADVSPGSNKKVWWRCSYEHIWQTAVYARTRKHKGTGCPICAGRTAARRIAYMDERPDKPAKPVRNDDATSKLQQEAV